MDKLWPTCVYVDSTTVMVVCKQFVLLLTCMLVDIQCHISEAHCIIPAEGLTLNLTMENVQMATVLIYLSAPEEGGETVFPLEGEHGLDRLPTINYRSCDQGLKVKFLVDMDAIALVEVTILPC